MPVIISKHTLKRNVVNKREIVYNLLGLKETSRYRCDVQY